MATTAGTWTQVNREKSMTGQVLDARAEDLTRAFVFAWDTVQTDVAAYAANPGDTTAARLRQAKTALNACARALAALAQHTEDGVTADVTFAVPHGADGVARVIATQLPDPETGRFVRASTGQLDAIVRRSAQRITSDVRPLAADATRAVRTALVAGVASGDNPRRTAAEILTRTESAFNGGLTRALVISRTETLDAYRAGALAERKANRDVLDGWQWIASLDKRTCPACLSMHLSIHPVDEAGPQGHQQCRCTAAPYVKPWSELGYDQPEPPAVVRDARDWYTALDPAAQTRIMGPTRAQGLADGTIGWEQLATRVSNTGWRDSYVATPVRDLVQR